MNSPTSSSPRLAYVGLDRQLHVIRADGSGDQQVSWPEVTGALTRWGSTGGEDTCTWPTWSPDGKWLACFRASEAPGELRRIKVCALQVDGVEERQLDALDDGLPLYASWSPDGRGLAVLIQRDDELELRACRLDTLGQHRVVDEGPPLFFAWLRDGSRVVLHAGGQSGKRVVVRDALGSAEDLPLAAEPGTFCAPMVVGDRLLFARKRGESSVLVSASPDGSDERDLWEMDGLMAFVPSPDGSTVAVSNVHRDSGPYDGVAILPLDGSGPPERVIDHKCLAFCWLPDGEGLLSVTIDEPGKCLWWHLHLLQSGDARRVAAFRPTREMMFQLHYFEQFVLTHPPVSPDGRWLVHATFPGAGTDSTDGPGLPQVEVVDLSDPAAAPRKLAQGRFATFAPGPSGG